MLGGLAARPRAQGKTSHTSPQTGCRPRAPVRRWTARRAVVMSQSLRGPRSAIRPADPAPRARRSKSWRGGSTGEGLGGGGVGAGWGGGGGFLVNYLLALYCIGFVAIKIEVIALACNRLPVFSRGTSRQARALCRWPTRQAHRAHAR